MGLIHIYAQQITGQLHKYGYIDDIHGKTMVGGCVVEELYTDHSVYVH